MSPAERDASKETARTEWSSVYSGAGVTAGAASLATTDAYVSATTASFRSAQDSTQTTVGRCSGRRRDSAPAEVRSEGRNHTTTRAAAHSPSSTGHPLPLSVHLAKFAGPPNKPPSGTGEPAKKLVQVSPMLSRASVLSRSPLLVLCFVVTAVIALWTMYLSARMIIRQNCRVDQPPFCCPEEASHLAKYVDESTQPCTNFANYVCAKGFQGGTDVDRPFNYPWSLVVEIALGLVETTGLKPVMTTGEVLNYFLHVSLKFHTASLLVVELPGEDLPSLRLMPYDIRLNKSQLELFGVALDTVIDRFNAKFNTNVSSADVTELDSKLHREFSSKSAFETFRIEQIGELIPSYTSEQWLTYTRIFVSPERTTLVNATFQFVLKAVIADVLESNLSALEKTQAVNVLSAVTMVPPPRDVIIPGASNAPLPTSEDFGLSYYSGLEHEFLLTKEMTLLGMPHGIYRHRPCDNV
ncbi:hypothetical protein MRX96_059666 [Rhipicephalus microplus]